MKRQDVEKTLVGVQVGTVLKLTYKKECLMDTVYLIGMARSGLLRFKNPMTEAIILAISQSGDWGNPSNRIVEVVIADEFRPNLEWFVGRTSDAIESLEIVP